VRLLRRHRRCDCGGGGGLAGERLYQGPQTVREGGIVSAEKLGVVDANGLRRNAAEKSDVEEGVERLVALGGALSDPIRVRIPIRVRMLGMMADGRGCCDFSSSGRQRMRGTRASASASSSKPFRWWVSRRSPTT
jgi:hypothetical protein